MSHVGLWSFYNDKVTELLNRLPFVRWDRLLESPEGLEVYGWIDRDDGRSDFVTVDIRLPSLAVAYATSSAERSREIGKLLYGDDDEHIECQRVEQRLPDVANKVAL